MKPSIWHTNNLRCSSQCPNKAVIIIKGKPYCSSHKYAAWSNMPEREGTLL